jgi:putative ABC transport system permease protein
MSRWARFFTRRERMMDDLDQEIRDFINRETQDNIERGMPPEEARYAALRKFGNVTRVKEDTWEVWSFVWLEQLWQDVRFGLRTLAKNPGFTAVAMLTLALGIGANTAIFSVVDAVLLHAAPYAKPYELVEISEHGPRGKSDGVSAGDLAEWEEQNHTFQGMAAYQQWEFHSMSGAGQPDEVWASPITDNLFQLLGVSAALGRTFLPNERQAVVLSHQYWRSHLSADPGVVGKALALDGKPYVVVGVAPADFEFPRADTQLWVPLKFDAADKDDHEKHMFSVIARLNGGVTRKQAQADLDLMAARLATAYPKTNAGWSASLKSFTGQEIGRTFREAVLALSAAVAFVLLIVCANVASMLLARGATRRGEMAVRAALGAGRYRLIRQLIVESLMLAGSASVAGVLLGLSGLRMIVSLVPTSTLIATQGMHRVSINLPVLGFTVALSLLTGTIVGLLPALRVTDLDLSEFLKEGGPRSGSGAGQSRLQHVLVAFEIALALILLVGAGLMIETFRRLETASTGFRPDHVLTVRVPLMNYKYSPGVQSSNFYRTLLERIEAIPGVKAAGMANNLPFTGFRTTLDLPAPTNSPGGPGRKTYVVTRSVSPGYFQALGIPLIEGRDFTDADNQKDARCVRIVNESMARRYWPGEDPVGKQLLRACPNDASALIVGVVADSKQDSVDSQAEPELYHPYAQFPFASFLVTFVVRTASNPADVAAAVRNAVWQIDHDQPVIQMRTMENVISESLWQQHLSALMLGVFAAIALLLSAVGIYGVLSYSVSRRAHEIGIRMAVGAERSDVLKLVVGHGLKLALAGISIGVAGGLTLTRFLSSLLYGVKATDPATFVSVALLLLAVALIAVYIPARRATKVDPMVALRYE